MRATIRATVGKCSSTSPPATLSSNDAPGIATDLRRTSSWAFSVAAAQAAIESLVTCQVWGNNFVGRVADPAVGSGASPTRPTEFAAARQKQSAQRTPIAPAAAAEDTWSALRTRRD